MGGEEGALSLTPEQPIRVVIVDDEPDLLFILRNHLARDSRFEVVGEATDGPEAVERCQSLEPDLVVLDVRMPTMDGMTAAAHIVKAAKPPAIALFTAFAESLDREEARELGADIIDKGAPLPWLSDHLADLVTGAPAGR